MKKFLIVKALLAFVLCFNLVQVNAENDKKKTSEVTFKVEMDCQSCANKVSKNIPFEKGVKDLHVDFKAQTVHIKYRQDKTNEENLKKAFEKIGLKAEGIKKEKCSTAKVSKCCAGH